MISKTNFHGKPARKHSRILFSTALLSTILLAISACSDSSSPVLQNDDSSIVEIARQAVLDDGGVEADFAGRTPLVQESDNDQLLVAFVRDDPTMKNGGPEVYIRKSDMSVLRVIYTR